MSNLRLAINVVACQLNWFACVLGAASGRPWLGLASGAATLMLHALLVRRPALEVAFVIAAACMGYATDFALVLAGVTRFQPDGLTPLACPLWMLMLWIGFATTLSGPLALLQTRPLLAAAVGALAGPLAYAGGARLGALALHPNPLIGVGGVALQWAIMLPLVTTAARAVFAARVAAALAGAR